MNGDCQQNQKRMYILLLCFLVLAIKGTEIRFYFYTESMFVLCFMSFYLLP